MKFKILFIIAILAWFSIASAQEEKPGAAIAPIAAISEVQMWAVIKGSVKAEDLIAIADIAPIPLRHKNVVVITQRYQKRRI